MKGFNTFVLVLLIGASTPAFATPIPNYCVAVNGGWNSGDPNGVTFVGKAIEFPPKNSCRPWGGIVRTAVSVVGTSHGTICRSSDGKLVTISLTSTLPEWLGIGRDHVAIDHIELCPLGTSGDLCPPQQGQSDRGDLGPPTGGSTGSPAKRINCNPSITTIPSDHA
jgi:hypothetical protein